MACVFLGLGSNVDAEDNLRLAITELRSRFGELELSPVYQSAALGFDGDDFLNLVLRLTTDENPHELLGQFEAIHRLAGRTRGRQRYTSRPLDIDLLLYDDLVESEPPLRLPRGDILEYGFVLKPLAEIAPDHVHPETGRTFSQHWAEFDAACHPLTRRGVIL